MQQTRAIASARAFLGDSFETVVSITDIEPTEDWHLWEDAEGNRLRIAKNKSVQVYPAKHKKAITKDVFRKSTPSLIAKHSYWILAIFGKGKTLLSFLGNDGILRTCYFEDDTWKYNISSVLLGYQALCHVSSGYIDTDPRINTSFKVSYPKEFSIEEVWASGFPTTDKKLQKRIDSLLR